MPEDCQRIMVFEKLCYYLKAFECKQAEEKFKKETKKCI